MTPAEYELDRALAALHKIERAHRALEAVIHIFGPNVNYAPEAMRTDAMRLLGTIIMLHEAASARYAAALAAFDHKDHQP